MCLRQPKMTRVRNNKKILERTARMSRWKYCMTKFFQFCKRTDLHGFKYIAMENLSVTERSVWGVAVIVSTICATFFVVTAYKWYARNPIVTVVESTQGAIWDIPFPAVTVCDLNVISKTAAKAFSTNLTLPENITSDFIFETLKMTPLLHSTTVADPDEKRNLHKLQDVLYLNNISIESLFRQLSPALSCANLVERCMWKNTLYRCDQLFQHIFTGINLCCTFNYYAIDDNIDKMRLFRFPTPRRVASCGYQTALTVIVRTDPDDYYSTGFASRGSLVFIDNAYNMPDLDSPVRLINPGSEILIAVSPERTYATPGIKSFPPNERQCYYNDELQKEPGNLPSVCINRVSLPTFRRIIEALRLSSLKVKKELKVALNLVTKAKTYFYMKDSASRVVPVCLILTTAFNLTISTAMILIFSTF